MTQLSVERSLELAVPHILDSSDSFSIDTSQIYLTNHSIEPDSSVITAQFSSPQSIVNDYTPPLMPSGTIQYDGKTISYKPKILNYGIDVPAHSEELHNNRMEPRTIDSGLYEAVLKHYLTECVSKVLPKIKDGRYLSDGAPLEVGKENKDFPGLFLAFSEKPIEELVGNKIISPIF